MHIAMYVYYNNINYNNNIDSTYTSFIYLNLKDN